MKGIVDYKHPKKMKKRRQLDALVDTIKLPRSRKNSSSAQELLDCHSDSSENDELTLPLSGSKKIKCCICQSIAARIVLFMATMACLTTCVGIIWVQWHLRHELDTLREQITSVQNSQAVPQDGLKIQSQLAEMNKSVTNLKTGPYGLQEITNMVTYIKSKLKELTEANIKLQTSVSASEEVLGLPAKMTALSSMLATLGGDFKDFMHLQTSKYTELEKRVAAIETQVKETNSNTNKVLENQMSQLLSQEMANYNTSLHSGLQSVNRDLERQSVRISTLEEFTNSRSSDSKNSLNNEEVNDMVTKLIEEKITAMPAVLNVSESSLAQETSEKIVKIMQKDEQFNDTLLVMRSELESLTSRMDSHDRALINLTTTLDGIKKQGISKEVEETHVKTPRASKVLSHSDDTSAGEDKAAATLHIEGINTYKDLVKVFNKSQHVNSQLDIKALNNLMNTTIQAEDLRQYDTDRNDLYGKDELAKALGFQRLMKKSHDFEWHDHFHGDCISVDGEQTVKFCCMTMCQEIPTGETVPYNIQCDCPGTSSTFF